MTGKKIREIYERLLAHYGEPQWWPAQSPYEIIVGAVLVQNTNWQNVDRALENFGANLTPEFVRDVALEELIEIIHPAGFYNQKARYLKSVTEWFAGYDFRVEYVQQRPLAEIRPELLAVRGVGEETCDDILLYAFSYPTFVVDAYTKRLCGRYPVDVGKKYKDIKDSFEAALPRDSALFNQYHALIVIHGQGHCRKKPLCAGCPLGDSCERYGI